MREHLRGIDLRHGPTDDSLPARLTVLAETNKRVVAPPGPPFPRSVTHAFLRAATRERPNVLFRVNVLDSASGSASAQHDPSTRVAELTDSYPLRIRARLLHKFGPTFPSRRPIPRLATRPYHPACDKRRSEPQALRDAQHHQALRDTEQPRERHQVVAKLRMRAYAPSSTERVHRSGEIDQACLLP